MGMTNEQAIEILSNDIEICTVEQEEACKMAIKALEQQPCKDWRFYYNHGYAQAKRDLLCDDCISREETLKYSHIEYDDDGEGHRVVYVQDIEDLPSVTPQPKVGKWIRSWCEWQQYLECSKCGYETGLRCDTKYCPNCGAKMEVEDDIHNSLRRPI